MTHMRVQKFAPNPNSKVKAASSPMADIDSSTEVRWDSLRTSSKHTAFPIYGAGDGNIRKGGIIDLGEVVFTGPDAVNRPIQVVVHRRTL